ncbi:aa3-type cytochrome oxidase subunit CtaJ [Blastococcus sp. SYSU D00820]
MSVVETILVFVGIPLAVFLLLALLTLVPGREKRVRYKSGQPWDFPPVWYEPHPVREEPAHHGADTQAIGSSVYGEPHAIESGHGSSARSHGASAAGHAPVKAGPLGGARGTW